MNRPSFNEAWLAFRKVNHSVADVGSIIGGNVGKNITGSYFQNACPIRMSYVLNATGFPIAVTLRMQRLVVPIINSIFIA